MKDIDEEAFYRWINIIKIKAQIDILEQLWSRKGMIDELRTELEQQLKELEDEQR